MERVSAALARNLEHKDFPLSHVKTFQPGSYVPGASYPGEHYVKDVRPDRWVIRSER